MKRLRNSILLLVFLVTTSLAVVLGTAPGFRFLLSVTNNVSDMNIRVEDVAGSLARGLELDAVSIDMPGLSITGEAMELDMSIFPLLYAQVKIAELSLDGFSIVQQDIAREPEPATDPGLPVSISIDDLRLRRLAFTGEDGREYRIDDFRASIEATDSTLQFSDLSLFAETFAVHGSGELDYQPGLRIDSDLSWTFEQQGELPAVSGTTRIEGDQDTLKSHTGFQQPVEGNLDLTVTDPLKELHWRAILETESFNPRGLHEKAPSLSMVLSMQADGTLDTVNLDSDLLLRNIDLPGMSFQGADTDPVTLGIRGTGRQEDDRFFMDTDLNWDGLTIKREATGTVTLPPGHLNLILEDDTLQARTETTFSVNGENGRLRLSASARSRDAVNLETLELDYGATSLQAVGRIDDILSTASVQLASRWRNITIPLPDNRTLQSPRGQFEITGRLDNYDLRADGELRSPGWPDVSARFKAAGDREHIELQPLTLSLLGGTATANGAIRWRESVRVDLAWTGKHLDPGRYRPEWPGNLDMEGRTTVTRQGEDYRLRIQSFNVRGQLRQEPFSLAVDSELNSEAVTLNHARLSSGDAFMEASGKLSQQDSDLEWQLDIPDLGAFMDDADGRLQGRGHYAGKPVEPVITGNLEAADIKTPWLNLEAMDTQLDVDLQQSGRIEIDSSVTGLVRDDQRINELQLQVDGTDTSHQYRLNAENEAARLSLNGTGSYAGKRWTGTTRKLSLTVADFGTWQLQQSAVTRIGQNGIQAEKLCLNRDAAGICLQGNWQDAEHWHAQADMTAIPMQLGKPWFPAYLDVESSFDLDLGMAVRDGTVSGSGALSLSPGFVDFRIDEDETQRFEVNGGNANVTLENGGLDGTARLQLADLTAPITAGLTLHGLEKPWDVEAAEVDLQGNITGRVDDLAFIASLNPYVTDSRGSINVDLRTAGTLAKPDLTGNFQLTDAGFHAPDLGVEITRMQIDGSTTESGSYRFRGQWYSGDGITRIDAALAEAENGGLTLQANLSGENTEIINLPEIQARASPDLKLDFSPEKRQVRGDILVTSALIDLDEVTSTTPVSDDVVLVNSNEDTELKEHSKLQTDLTIRFGEDIRVRGEGITGSLGGQLAISSNEQGEFIASGEVAIKNGEFSAYGRSLTIEEGRLIYQQSRLDNPEVRIRAVREVDDITAGVRVSGYLASPTVNLFSTPTMNQEQILSYIVFGRPLAGLSSGEGADLVGAATSMGLQNSGFITSSLSNTFGLDEVKVKTEPGAGVDNASLIVGKYLTPNLYLSYGVGLFESISTAKIRYDISKRWSVEARQGSEMGADLLYRLEQ